jgi:glucose-1-phosphate cytidylyltransferase
MKVVILAGGRGSRLGNLTDETPKPMVKIGGIPMIDHIINRYRMFGKFEFIVAGGWRSDVLAEHYYNSEDVQVFHTGNETTTGGRLWHLHNIIDDETFMFTYGDGIADIDIGELIHTHVAHGKNCTVTAVRPPARFGRIITDANNKVLDFAEKPQSDEGWINGGFFVCDRIVLYHIGADMAFEGRPMEGLAEIGHLYAYHHTGFWQCMDVERDVKYLNELCERGAPWIK